MSNHKTQTWDHRGSKPPDSKFLPLNHHLDGYHPEFSKVLRKWMAVGSKIILLDDDDLYGGEWDF